MLRWTTTPDLDDPIVVAAFSGWNDAGDAASDALRHVARVTASQPAGTVEPDGYIDYQATRPHVEIVAGTVRALHWPSTELRVASQAPIVTLLGPEPSFGWKQYCEELVASLVALAPRLVVTLGALLGDTPHTRPIRITGTATDDALAGRLRLERSRYEGPTGIVGVVHSACQAAGLPSASLWAPVPHYAATPPSPKATAALVDRLAHLTGTDLAPERLEIAAAAWEEQVSALVERDDEMRRYVAELEERYERERPAPEADARDADGGDEPATFDPDEIDRLAADIEAFLADRDDQE